MRKQPVINQIWENTVIIRQVQAMNACIRFTKLSSQKKRQIVEEELKNAIKEEEFVVYYQPQFDAVTEQMVGAEALIRWKKKDGSFILPSEFIPVYEKNGLIVILDEYVFRHVCQYQKEKMQQKKELFPISVNLSRASINEQSVAERYHQIIREYGLPFWCVPLELTESASIENEQFFKTANQLVQKGFLLHMDDFGSGYSSLLSLSQIPFRTLKLDKHLIDQVHQEKGYAIVKQMIQLARLLHMDVVAEGVETKAQAEILKKIGCCTIQGFYYAAPMAEDVFREF